MTYPRWLRATLVGLQAAAIVGGIWLGNATYDRWSRPDVPDPEPTTTTVVTPETEVAPLG